MVFSQKRPTQKMICLVYLARAIFEMFNRPGGTRTEHLPGDNRGLRS